MTFSKAYAQDVPTREQIDASAGAAVLEFGVDWCGFCRAAQPAIATALAGRPGVQHIKVEDGPGRALGRSYRIKLWPTLVFLSDGQETARLVRPTDSKLIEDALARIDPQQTPDAS